MYFCEYIFQYRSLIRSEINEFALQVSFLKKAARNSSALENLKLSQEVMAYREIDLLDNISEKIFIEIIIFIPTLFLE